MIFSGILHISKWYLKYFVYLQDGWNPLDLKSCTSWTGKAPYLQSSMWFLWKILLETSWKASRGPMKRVKRHRDYTSLYGLRQSLHLHILTVILQDQLWGLPWSRAMCMAIKLLCLVWSNFGCPWTIQDSQNFWRLEIQKTWRWLCVAMSLNCLEN